MPIREWVMPVRHRVDLQRIYDRWIGKINNYTGCSLGVRRAAFIKTCKDEGMLLKLMGFAF